MLSAPPPLPPCHMLNSSHLVYTFVEHDRLTAEILGMTIIWQAVVINLCIDTKLTRLLGVENHVCELQLCVQTFAEKVRPGIANALDSSN
jgi:hypothetical protein